MNPVNEFLEDSQPNVEYYLLVTGAAIIALFGILIDNIAVLIAAMIVAPLIQPIIVAAYGFASGKYAYIVRATKTFGLSIIAVVIVTTLGVAVFHVIAVPSEERVFISFNPRPVSALVIAFVGGIFATLGIFSKRIDSIIVGIGIAVSLMPPLVASCIGIIVGWGDLAVRGATIFGLNVLGIFAGSALMLFLMRKNLFNFRRYLEENATK
jgi:uncharacterized hydrophobic protein (TIGR00271 family)